MNIYCIACGVFKADLKEVLPLLKNKPEIQYLEGGLHADPSLLRKELQSAIDQVPEFYDRIVLLYGVCGKGVIGLQSLKQQVVIPQVHDCISLFLGGGNEYKKQFSHKPGTYYISAGWYEEQIQPKGKNKVQIPKEYADDLNPQSLEEKFGSENSEHVRDFFDSWKQNYSRSVFINTGTGRENIYQEHAQKLASVNDWEYQELKGSTRLILESFSEELKQSNEDFLVIAPRQEILFDPSRGQMYALGESEDSQDDVQRDFHFSGQDNQQERNIKIGLGIDAGGTYTDAVLYDFENKKVLDKAKALTTKWQFSLGIMNAVKKLDSNYLKKVELVSLSTTLVTNAIVENNIYPVGLLFLPAGNMGLENQKHSPSAIIKGRMNIEGEITEQIDPDEIRQIADKMIQTDGVQAFAVSAYAASVNPELELQVKHIVREHTKLDVCCGHELSGTLNLYVRAHTAVLNAAVIPIMEDFLNEMSSALEEVSIKAPQIVVKGDGSVMTSAYAKEFPVQTALSGPAASMAGAAFFSSHKDALVIDVGGTTSDLGLIENGQISICDDGANISSWRTHVKAVDMFTIGLGGDSKIHFAKGLWNIGPQRITPFSALDSQQDLTRSVDFVKESPLDEGSSEGLEFLYSTGKKVDFKLNSIESKILESLQERPMTILELSKKHCHGVIKLLKTDRLEKHYSIQRAGLTPTDLYHINGSISVYQSSRLNDYYSLIEKTYFKSDDSLEIHLHRIIQKKVMSIILERTVPQVEDLDDIISVLLSKGNRWIQLNPILKFPVIGLGAAAKLLLKDAVKALSTPLIIHENSDVANAVGAISSKVSISSEARISPVADGSFRIHGFPGNHDFETLEEAEQHCLVLLTDKTREIARLSGTSNTEVFIKSSDKTALSASGDTLFLERHYASSLQGIPNLF